MPGTQYGLPMVVSELGSNVPAQGLKRVRLDKTGLYDEAWLQNIIMRHPGLLPIAEIEPAFVPAIPISVEVSVPSGFIDNLYATPTGDLIIGETKLFRNPEARREVIGQIIDYAKDLSNWTYAELDAAVRKARPAPNNGGGPSGGLFATVQAAVGPEGVEEARFIDAVSRNLSRGRFLLLVIGDGIQEGIEGIARFLQQHGSLHFTFGLVELTIHELPPVNGTVPGYLIQPRIIARTFNIDRGTYAIAGDKIVFKAPAAQDGQTVPTKTTITEERFYEELEATRAGVTGKLRDFIARLEALDVHVEYGTKSLILRWHPDEARAWNLGSVQTTGKVWTEFLNAQADQVGLLDLSHRYLAQVAASVPGAFVKSGPKATSSYVAKGKSYVMIDDLLDHADGWYHAIKDFTTAASSTLASK